MNSTLSLAVQRTARKLAIDHVLVEQVYKSYWGFFREYISDLQLSGMTSEELDSEVTNLNIPRIGKLYADYNEINKYKRQLKFYQNVKNKKSKANRKPGTGD